MKQTLGQFAGNPDGKTFDGRKVAQWLFEAATGKPMSAEEAQQMIDQAQARARSKRPKE